jgi:adenylate kinase
MDLDIIFFIGPQGSGKGTQARLLAEKLGFYYWEMGAILREEAKQDNEFGRHVADLINNGNLLDDADLLEVITDKLELLPRNQGIIFDGIPRRIGQAQFLLDYLRAHGRTKFTSIFLDIPFDVSVARLLERAHHEFRKDDTEEGIRTRLALYEKETLPVIELLSKETTKHDIDGTPSIPEVTTEINQALGLTDDKTKETSA